MTSTYGPRWLLGLRISNKHDASTSIDKQRGTCTAHVTTKGGTIAGEAVDEGVSGALDPFQRGHLGDWLTNRTDQFDAIVFHHLDRASRETLHVLLLLQWAEDQGKRIVLLGPTYYDTETAGVGERISLVVNAELARAYRKDIQAKINETVKLDRQLGKWLGGRIPFWLTVVEHESGKGRRLKLKPEDSQAVRIVLEIIERVEKGERYRHICDDLDKRGIPLPDQMRDSINKKKPWRGAKLEPGGWSGPAIRFICNSRLLIGEKEVTKKINGVKTRTIVRGPDGNPVRYCEPLITYDRFMKLRKLVEEPRQVQTPTSNGCSLQGAITCARCGALRYLHTGKKGDYIYYYYRCSREQRRKTCLERLVRADRTHEELAASVDTLIGDAEIFDKIEPPRIDYTGRLAHLRDEREAITELYVITKSQSGRDRYRETLQRLDDEIETLERLEANPPQPQYVSTGQTFADMWTAANWDERGDLLRRIGATFAVGHDDDGAFVGNLLLPPDVHDRLRAITSGKSVGPVANTFPYPATEYLTKESSK